MSKPAAPRQLTLDAALDRLADVPCSRPGCTQPRCLRAVSERLLTSRRTLHRWIRDGITVHQAEEIALALDTHPAELWGADRWNRALLAQDYHEARTVSGRILAVLEQLGRATAGEIANHLGRARSGIYHELRDLIDAGDVVRIHAMPSLFTLGADT